jgi:hypothetical protein
MSDFLPYQESFILCEELGFNEPCYAVYSEYDQTRVYDNDSIKEGKTIPAILNQQAFRWFREKKLCDGSVCRHGVADGGYSYRWDILHEYGVYEERHFKQGYNTYEEAELACIKKLIEFVKNKNKI